MNSRLENKNGNRKVAVIFDMDGVIIDSAPYHYAAWQTVWKKKGISFSLESFKHNFGRRSEMQVKEIIGDDAPEKEVLSIAREKDALFREIVKGNIKPLPGAVELIASLKEYGVPIAVGSSAPDETVNLVIKALGIDRYFDAVVSGSEVTEGKPSPQIFLKAARKLGCEPEKCLVIEDAAVGITAAKLGRMYALAVTNTHPREVLKDADIIVDSLAEVTAAELKDFIYSKIDDKKVEA